jgi:hypothetical protein
MQIFYHLLNKDKVVMYASGFDEGSLIVGDHVVKLCTKSICQDLRYNFGKAVSQTYGSIIRDLLRILPFWNKHHISLIKKLKVLLVHHEKTVVRL